MIGEIGDDILSNMNSVDSVAVYRIYYGDRILQMDSGKYQWNNVSAAKNALHNMIDTYLQNSHSKEWWLLKEPVYQYIMTKVEVRRC